MLGPYVDIKISTRRGNCNNMKMVTGILANKMVGIIRFRFPSSIIIRVAQKDTIMAATESKRVESPMINFLGNDSRNSSSA